MRRGLILLGLTLAIIPLGIYFFYPVRNISCLTTYGDCDSKTIFKLAPLLGKNHFSVSPQSITRLLSPNSQISAISVKRAGLGTVNVFIAHYLQLGLLQAPSGDLVVVNDRGLVSPSMGSALPVIFVSDLPPIGSQVDARTLSGLRLINRLAGDFKDRITGVITGPDITITLPFGTSVIVGLDKQADNWYTALQLILERSKIGGKIPRKIDMRFSDPILTY